MKEFTESLLGRKVVFTGNFSLEESRTQRNPTSKQAHCRVTGLIGTIVAVARDSEKFIIVVGFDNGEVLETTLDKIRLYTEGMLKGY